MAVDDINVLARRTPVPPLVPEPLRHAALTTKNTGSFTIDSSSQIHASDVS
jgi:hypothetical protein